MSYEAERLRILERVANGELTPQQGSLEIAMLKTVYGTVDTPPAAGRDLGGGPERSAEPFASAEPTWKRDEGAPQGGPGAAPSAMGPFSWGGNGQGGASGSFRFERHFGGLNSLHDVNWRQVPWPVWVAIAVPLVWIVGLSGLFLAGIAALVTLALQIVWNAGLQPLLPQTSPLGFFPAFWIVGGLLLLYTIAGTVRRVRAAWPFR